MWLSRIPLFVILTAIGALAMLLPSIHALSQSQFEIARVFFYGAILFSIIALLLALTTLGRRTWHPAAAQLATLIATLTVLPAMLALPLYVLLPRVSFTDSWFEMASAITTTGFTVFDRPSVVPMSLHLWRAEVGWLGGFLMWVAALAVFSPMSLGGFEVRARGVASGAPSRSQIARITDPNERMLHYAAKLGPLYLGLTLVLWLALIMSGQPPAVGLIHAMSTLSTSGITPYNGLTAAPGGFLAEVVIFVFMAFAISRLTFSRGLFHDDPRNILTDPEVRLAAVVLIAVPAVMFLRHYLAAHETTVGASLGGALQAIWGAAFTVMSFLTTTGFESSSWQEAARWSGLSTPGIVLMALSLIGGGIATTAGGIKLLRVYALVRHGEREIGRLIHPSSLGGSGSEARHIRRQGAFLSWIFFMIFAISIGGVMIGLSLTGVQFDTGMVLAAAALSTTGPLAEVAAEAPILLGGIPDAGKCILVGAMVLGRLEALAIIALLNPEIWRR